MQVIHLAFTMPDETAAALERHARKMLHPAEDRFPSLDMCRYVIDEDADVYRPDGTLLLALRRGAIHPRTWEAAADAVTRAAREPDPMFGRKTVTGGQENFRSGTLGYMRGELRGATRADMAGYRHAVTLAMFIGAVFREQCRAAYESHRRAVGRIPPRLLMPGTLFTSMICNRTDTAAGVTARTACHRDKGNLPSAYGGMSVWGEFMGGHLIFPLYRVAVNLRPLDVLIADNRELHGNEAIRGTRLSVVCYAHSSNAL